MCACCGGRSFHLIESPAIVPQDGGTVARKIMMLWCQDCSHLHSFLQDSAGAQASEAS
jgi:hypothetical protein